MKTHLILALLLLLSFFVHAQSFFCPENIDFEQGDLSHWQFYAGHCCPFTFTASPQIPSRISVVSGTNLDPYGLFPVLAPGGGNYSLKLGNDASGGEAEKVTYTFTIPQGLNDYCLIYRFAVVFEDPNHQAADQPRFVVQIYDSATKAVLPCASHTYVAGGGLPGFKISPVNADVLYRDWSTASIDLSNMAGKTLIAEFSTADCSLGGHFGYGYIDLTCGAFKAEAVFCAGDSVVKLNAPPGFATYTWYDSTFSHVVGNGKDLQLPKLQSGQYKVILSPFPGYGCPDTLETNIKHTLLSLVTAPEIQICEKDTAQLLVNSQGSNGVVHYAWSPQIGLSCYQCNAPQLFPGNGVEQFTVTATDSMGCTATERVMIVSNPKYCCQDLFIPNAFSPNGDGVNDVFRISTYLDIEVKNWTIYNRWGKLLWHSTRYYDKWDGTFEYEAQEMGVYFYIFEYKCLGNGKTYTRKGDLSLLR